MPKRLYQLDSYQTAFRAKVVDISQYQKGIAVVLDATLFYPESGGQPSDRGELGGEEVVDVIEGEDEILHILAKEPTFKIGDEIEGRIAWERRFINMQQHTGQHVLSQAFLRRLGAKTVSSSLGTEHSTIDIDKLNLTWSEVEEVERLANKIVYENRSVRIYEVASGEAQGLRVKKPVDRDVLRIVEVEDFDKSPCGGTHCRRTGEVGLIKVLRWEKVRHTSRVEFICGRLAELDYFWKSRFIVELAQEMTTKDTSIPAKIRSMIGERKELARTVEKLQAQLVRYEAHQLEDDAERIGGAEVIVRYFPEKGPGAVRTIALELTKKPGRVAMLAGGRDRLHLVFSRSEDLEIDMRPLMRVACEVIDGRGGGKPEVCQGGGRKVGAVQQALERARENLHKIIAKA